MACTVTPIRPPNRLGLLREAADDSRARMAAGLGVDSETIGRWERGEEPIPAEYAPPLALRYGVAVGYLMNERDR